MRTLIVGLVLTATGTFAFGQGQNPAFDAICKDVNTHGYRDATDFREDQSGGVWTTAEKFGSTWKFTFTPPDQISIDEKMGYVLAQNPGLIIVVEAPGNNGNAAGVWTYAIHIGMQKVVGSQVNAYGTYGAPRSGVKARSTNFDCNFQLK
ncbi:hypothetical protein [Marinobacter shengliensis]|uniref:hypothetical protein n=1 Tax=Marinobacter shengliensis TaxID=1389223 RepID=UPI002573515B|nr:hypothetical protein [Marinobacter shengliensis]BEH13086.1 hypothetical protein MAALD49_04540 [Marinobacter shengliensis]